jgi:hypothetical protein
MFKPALALRFKRFQRRFGVLSPRVVVRAEFPRALVFLFLIFLLLLDGWVVWIFCSAGKGESAQLEMLRQRLYAQQLELDSLRSTVGTGKNEISMERAAQLQLQGRLSELEAENSGLKEDMLIFERLIPVVAQGPLVRIESFKVQGETSTRYRYRLLLAFQASPRSDGFKGVYQVVARFSLAGSLQQKIYPGPGGSVLEMQHFLRREGVIELPLGAKLATVELRLLQDGKLIGKQDARF